MEVAHKASPVTSSKHAVADDAESRQAAPSFTAKQSKKGDVVVMGGAGYIGTHTALVLLNAGYDVTVMDNLVNSSEEAVKRVRKLAGCGEDRLRFFNVDICDAKALRAALEAGPEFAACIHFAGLKAVGESVEEPLLYYENNLISTLTLLRELGRTKCRSLVFSSSATVYGTAEAPITEGAQVGVGITNPYGRTKFFIEEILKDFCKSPGGSDWKVESLRYFNPVGAHPSGEIGEHPHGPPNNLMPYVSQVAVGKRDHLTIFGDDYDTPDGTGVRDYIHVMDLAEGHLKAMSFMNSSEPGFFTHNLGTGRGYSVKEMVTAFEKACGKKIAFEVGPRRGGDLDTIYADPKRAEEELGWKAQLCLDDMVRDLWAWQSHNPDGYDSKPRTST